MADVLTINALLRIPLELVDPGPNVRDRITGIDELAMSIKTLGMQKPLLVIDTGNGRYRILDGHRRHAAAKRLGLDTVDAILRREVPEAVRIQRQLAIQAQTEGFDPIAEARALHTLMWEHNLSREQIAEAVGHSPAWVRDRIALLQLAEDEKRSVAAGTMGVAEANGRAIPVDAEPPLQGGNVALEPGPAGKPIARVLTAKQLTTTAFGRQDLRTSHFARCPQADQWRHRARTRGAQ